MDTRMVVCLSGPVVGTRPAEISKNGRKQPPKLIIRIESATVANGSETVVLDEGMKATLFPSGAAFLPLADKTDPVARGREAKFLASHLKEADGVVKAASLPVECVEVLVEETTSGAAEIRWNTSMHNPFTSVTELVSAVQSAAARDPLPARTDNK